MIIKYTRFAIIPKYCDKCHRKFWLEPYDIFYRDIGIYRHNYKMVRYCKKCIERSESEENNGR